MQTSSAVNKLSHPLTFFIQMNVVALHQDRKSATFSVAIDKLRKSFNEGAKSY